MTVTQEMEKMLLAVLNKAAAALDVEPNAEVSIVLADDAYIQELNCQYRGKDMPTDVLSFALNEGEEPEIIDGPEENLLGDIIISLETAQRQAVDYGHSLERELAFLTVHGFLHLLGYDHEKEDQRQTMRAEEERILELIGLSRN
ncbi:MAG: metalloprotease ybeY [Firmicutes bacterium]|nr:metalloprotease ybeY [Bacillota bacterium]